ncbi:MAG: hypothetical protein AB7P16_27625 [Bradyrhizobium sp.]|uniref:hypothetical protein n=1 Tax=Bradyrhizobium sp. TaxID=376 RepID=UPI003D145E6B
MCSGNASGKKVLNAYCDPIISEIVLAAKKAAILIQIRPFEPSLPQDRDGHLADLAMALAVESAALTASRPAELSQALGRLARSMNCYYSNLIEGHHTHPIDIQRALAGNYDAAPGKRNLQLEARAHIEVQQSIDEDQAELCAEVGDGGNREGGISWGCLTTSLLHRRSDMPCRTIMSPG